MRFSLPWQKKYKFLHFCTKDDGIFETSLLDVEKPLLKEILSCVKSSSLVACSIYNYSDKVLTIICLLCSHLKYSCIVKKPT